VEHMPTFQKLKDSQKSFIIQLQLPCQFPAAVCHYWNLSSYTATRSNYSYSRYIQNSWAQRNL